MIFINISWFLLEHSLQHYDSVQIRPTGTHVKFNLRSVLCGTNLNFVIINSKSVKIHLKVGYSLIS